MEHIGSADSDTGVQALVTLAYERLHRDDVPLPGMGDDVAGKGTFQSALTHQRSFSGVLYDALAGVYELLGFVEATGSDEVFQQLVIGRIIEPTSKLDTIRVLHELGLPAPSNTGVHRCLARIAQKQYRQSVSASCLKHRGAKNLSLVLYDVTTLYFQIDREDDFRKPGLSKERRLEPQIVVGLLVDQAGFPLAVHSFEGNMSETKTIQAVLDKFTKENPEIRVSVVADAAMLSASNLNQLEQAGYGYVVGSRLTKTPYEIEEHTNSGNALEDGQIFDTRMSMAGPERTRVQRRVVYQYRAKRAQMDLKNIDTVVKKAQSIINGTQPLKKNRFLSVTGSEQTLNDKLVASAKTRVGIKGYVTNLTEAPEVIIDAYHQLFNVERSFRISKSDLKARPIYHQKREKIESHLTIVFAALAVSRHVQERTGLSIKRFVKTLAPLRTAIISIGSHEHTAKPHLPDEAQEILAKLPPQGVH